MMNYSIVKYGETLELPPTAQLPAVYSEVQ